MAIRFLIGRAGSGKTETVLQELRGELLREPDGPPLILLVPEQATFQAEHALVSTPGIAGLLRLQVLSFRRFAWRVMQQTGGTAGIPIDDLGKKMLLQKLLHKHGERLQLFRSVSEQMGFVDRLHSLFGEWVRYRLTAGELEAHLNRLFTYSEKDGVQAEAAGMDAEPTNIGRSGLAAGGGANETDAIRRRQLAAKLKDLLPLYRDYEWELTRFLDADRFLDRLAETLSQVEQLREARVWIDGFHGFTPQEQEVVAACMQHCRSVTLTLTLNRPYRAEETPHELDLFYPTAMTMCKLQRVIRERHLPEPVIQVLKPEQAPRFRQSPMLAHLESHYEKRLSPGVTPYKPAPGEQPQLTVRAAVHRKAEVEAAAREMIRLVRDEGYRWRDIAVRVRNLEDYGDLLKMVLEDYGIPYFMDQKRGVLHHPLAEFVRSALEVVVKGWAYDSVFRCVKTDLLLPLDPDGEGEASTLNRHAMDQLENYVLAFGIRGNRWFHPDSWTLKRIVSLEESDDPEGGNGQKAEEFDTETIRQCARLVVEPLKGFQDRLKQATTVREMAEALYRLLEQLHVPEKLARWSERCVAAGQPEKAREHAQMWDKLMNLLDQLVGMIGEEQMSLELFSKLLETGLDSIRLGLVPPALDQVLIGSIDRTRTAQVKHAFVLGVEDGVLPKRMTDDGILDETEREWLLEAGVPMADSSRRKLLDEQFLIYTILCAPSEHLWLSYPLADEEGRALLPSEVIRQLRRMFPGLPEETVEAEPREEMAEEEQKGYISRPVPTLSYLTVQLKRWLSEGEMSPIWWAVYNWYACNPEWKDRIRLLQTALFYVNKVQPLDRDTTRALYGDQLRSSVSRMERFAACPFSHFASYGLKLRERRIYRLEAPDIGQLYHAALGSLANELLAEGLRMGDLPERELLARVERIVDRLSPRLQGAILTSSARYGHIARKLKGIVGKTSLVLAEHSRRSAFVPVGLEVGFGPGEQLPALTLPLGDGKQMHIIGRIDRIDRAVSDNGTYLRIIDYKSSATDLKWTELFYGLSLQMLTYLDVVLTHSEQWLGVPAKPAGVLYFHVHNPFLTGKNRLEPNEALNAIRKKFKMKGLVAADAEAVYLMDSNLKNNAGYSDMIPVAIKRDGSFYKNVPAVQEAQWDQLRRHVRKTILRIGERIADGDASIRPYRMGKRMPCSHCPFQPVCQYDRQIDGNEPNWIQPVDKERIWLELGRDVADAMLAEGIDGREER